MKEQSGKELNGRAQGGKGQGEAGKPDSPMAEIHISVRGLVEFVLRHGDLDNRHQAAPEDAMQEGGRIHRKIQKRMGAEYQAEVTLKHVLPSDGYVLVVEGRADGIIHQDNRVTIDEIKGTYRELARMREPQLLHLAQAKCYAYIYALQQKLESIRVRMTYCNLVSEELRYFHEDYTFGELEEWFLDLVSEYLKWSDYSWKWLGIRQASINGLGFPFSYREGQKELVTNVYKTIYHKKKLYIEAPTGVGKTLSTIYPAVQAMGKGMGEKLFYLTAKTITRTVAEDALEILRKEGLRFKSVILTAKEKICFMEETECNPEYCPYAKGHYDRINDAVFDMLTNEESFSRDRIEKYARRHSVCPFEMCLDMSLFADAVIGDYNYLFDPHVYLKRFFADSSEGKYLFLIDEAHNLLERGREMYSAMLYGDQFAELTEEIKKTIMSECKENVKKSDISGQMTLEMTQVMTEMSINGWPEYGEGGSAGLIGAETGEGLGTEGIYLGDETGRDAEGAYDFAVSGGCSAGRDDGSAGRLLGNIGGDGGNIGGSSGNAGGECGNIGRPSGNAGGDGANAGGAVRRHHGGRSVLVRQGYADKMIYQLEKCRQELLHLGDECGYYRFLESVEAFVQNLLRLQATMDDYLVEPEEETVPVRDLLLDAYFAISHFLLIYDLLDENYVKYSLTNEEGDCMVKLFCVNPKENLKKCMNRGRSSILFSATFLPIQYYKELLGGEKEDYEVYAQSVFDPAKRGLFIARDVTSKYSRRSEEEYYRIARYIEEIVRCRQGNYMVFCPSYAFLRVIYETYVERFAGEDTECILQGEAMSETEREEFLARFQEASDDKACGDSVRQAKEDRTLVGFCVLGGIFSEGIDLKNDSLIGAVIVGTGIPQVGGEREILKEYFEANGENGFDYAYRYPGMNKVLQAAGRVIRTVEDAGVIALLDERFLQYTYRRLFPREWISFEEVTVDTVAGSVKRFWENIKSEKVWK